MFWSINIISEVFPIFIFICHKCIISYHLLIHLGNCFKKNLKQDLEEIEFVEEIEYIKSYLEIEKARFQDKLNVIFDIPEDFNCYIPLLLLQPIVENAVKHGVLAKVQGGTAKNTNDETIFIVEDGGMVMEEKFVETLLKDIHV